MSLNAICTDANKIPDDTYVLIQVSNRPWNDSVDPVGCFWKTARRKRPGSTELMEFGPGTYDLKEVTGWTHLPHNTGV